MPWVEWVEWVELSESCECRSVNKDRNQSALLAPTHSLWEDQLPPQDGHQDCTHVPAERHIPPEGNISAASTGAPWSTVRMVVPARRSQIRTVWS